MKYAIERRDEILKLCAEAAALEQAIQMAESIPDDKRTGLLAHAQELSAELYLIAEKFMAPPEVL